MLKQTLIKIADSPTRDGRKPLDRMRVHSDDKAELEHHIGIRLMSGWQLVSRSYSMDDGHGAELVRSDPNEAPRKGQQIVRAAKAS